MHKPSLKHKSKRVLKKLYLGEFAMMGFEVFAKFTEDDETKINSFFDDLLDFFEAKNLGFSGGYTINDFDGIITAAERYQSVDEKASTAVKEWLLTQEILSDVVVGKIIDVNYD